MSKNALEAVLRHRGVIKVVLVFERTALSRMALWLLWLVLVLLLKALLEFKALLAMDLVRRGDDDIIIMVLVLLDYSLCVGE